MFIFIRVRVMYWLIRWFINWKLFDLRSAVNVGQVLFITDRQQANNQLDKYSFALDIFVHCFH